MNSSEKREFPGISSAAFQHPLDVQATQNLRRIPLLSPLLKTISGAVFEKQMRLFSISNMIRLGPTQGHSIYDKFVQVATILDLPELPQIYISNQYTVNAYAYGVKKYQVVLFSGLIDALSEEELLAVIGHELGHIKCDHMLFKSIAYLVRWLGLEFFKSILPAGTGLLASLPLLLAILHWERMAEFSCDRASLLVVQDKEVVANALSKLAGGSQKILPEINLDDILKQAGEFEEAGTDFLGQIFKVNMMLLQTHPFPIVRVKEILQWADTKQYQDILAGDYLLKTISAAAAVSEPTSKICPNCKQLANASASKCGACGASLQEARLVCSKCQVKVFPGWQSCPGCGSQLQPQPAEAMAVG